MPGYSITNGDMSREVMTDNGDGTGTLEFFRPDGTLLSSESLTLPILEPEHAPLEDQIAALTSVITDIGAALGTITPSSTSTATRTALLNVRAVIDAALGSSDG